MRFGGFSLQSLQPQQPRSSSLSFCFLCPFSLRASTFIAVSLPHPLIHHETSGSDLVFCRSWQGCVCSGVFGSRRWRRRGCRVRLGLRAGGEGVVSCFEE